MNPQPLPAPGPAPLHRSGRLQLVADPDPHPGPLVAVAPGKNLRGVATLAGSDIASGLGKDGKPVTPSLQLVDLKTLFAAQSRNDAHVVAYVIEKDGTPLDRQPRLCKESLGAVLAAGYCVNCYSVWIDVDLKDLVGRPGKDDPPKLRWWELTPEESEDVWRRIESARLALAAKGMEWAASYTTPSGLRFVHPLALAVPAGRQYEALVARFLAAYAIAKLPADEACKDWTRLFRAPGVTLESGLQTWGEDWFTSATDFDDDSCYYVPADADLVPPKIARHVEIVRTAGRPMPDPIQAQSLAEELDESTGRYRMTDAGRAAKRALADSAVFPWIYDKAPLAFPGKRHDMLTRAVGTVVATLHDLAGMTPEFVFGLLYEPVGRFGEDEDWTGKLWEMATSFWDGTTHEKAGAAESNEDQASPSFPEPSGMNAAEWLAYMNRRHAVVRDFGGKCRVIGWRDEHGRDVLYHQSFEDVRKGYSNRSVRLSEPKGDDENAVKQHPVGAWWLGNRKRRQFERVVYAPGRNREFDGCLNLWKGWGVDPVAGDWSLMRRHVVEVLANGNEDHADYILRWAAWTVQNPGRVAEVALVFRGGEGTGKGTFARAMKDLFGQHGVHVTSGLELTGRFNSHMRDCSLLFADEAVAPEDRDAVGRLKAMVTEPTIRVEQKGIDSQEFPNCLHVIMASNERWVVPAGEGDRRFVVFDVSEGHKEDRDWFGPLFAQLEAGGLAAMLHDLLAMPLGNWHPRQGRPKTDAHAEQKAQSLRGVDRLWFDCLASGELPAGSLLAGGDAKVSTSGLLDEFRKRDNGYSVNAKNLGALLFEKGMRFEDKRPGGKARLAIIPPLSIARQRWDATRFPFPWPAADGWSIG